jgi:hypothetical protein
MFWGAPLVAREVESGTFRLGWTQSVTRTRWPIVKVTVVALIGMAVARLLGFLLTWWASPLDRAHGNQYATFDQRDIVVLGYTAFAVTLGVSAGTVIRRTLPAMATTLIAFIATRLAANFWVRPHLLAPAHPVVALDPATTGAPNIPNAWITSTQIVNKVPMRPVPPVGRPGKRGSVGGVTL